MAVCGLSWRASAQEVTVSKVDGTAVSGRLTSLDQSAVVVQTGPAAQRVPADQTLQVNFVASDAEAEPAKLEIRLIDGSRLAAESYRAAGDESQMQLATGGMLSVPVKAVASLRVPIETEAEKTAWEQFEKLDLSGDLVAVRKKDSIDYLEGIVHNVTGEAVEFEVDGEVLPVKWPKLFGLIFYKRDPEGVARGACMVVDRNKSAFAAKSVKLAGEQLEIELAAGGRFTLPIADARRIDFSQGKVVYLSDLDWDAQASERTPFFGPSRPIGDPLDLFAPQRDRALDGGELLLGKKPYAKGLALHSRTRLVYRLPSGYRRFSALVGIDDRMERRGDVQFVVEGDGRRLFEREITGDSEPAPVDLDVVGVKRLAITVDFGSDQDVADHLDLCEARLIQ